MNHRKHGRKLGRNPEARAALYRTLLHALLKNEKIETTDAKAKELRRFAERVITHAKKGGLARIRLVERVLRDKEVLHKLFADIGPRYVNRPGGYTRILKLGNRRGDNAAMSIIELVESDAPGVPATPADPQA
jgi:large subunit ribosomal protein L17